MHGLDLRLTVGAGPISDGITGCHLYDFLKKVYVMNQRKHRKQSRLFLFLIVLVSMTVGFSVSAQQPAQTVSAELIQCFADKGLTIYGSSTCPACRQLAMSLGGYENIKPIYVECSENREKCTKDKQTGYVPEIHVNGKLYQGSRAASDLATAVGCSM